MCFYSFLYPLFFQHVGQTPNQRRWFGTLLQTPTLTRSNRISGFAKLEQRLAQACPLPSLTAGSQHKRETDLVRSGIEG